MFGQKNMTGNKGSNSYFQMQSEIAQAIAEKLKATITPEEKQLIEKAPTTNLTAYDLYLRGLDEETKFWLDNNNQALLKS